MHACLSCTTAIIRSTNKTHVPTGWTSCCNHTVTHMHTHSKTDRPTQLCDSPAACLMHGPDPCRCSQHFAHQERTRPDPAVSPQNIQETQDTNTQPLTRAGEVHLSIHHIQTCTQHCHGWGRHLSARHERLQGDPGRSTARVHGACQGVRRGASE